MKQSRYKMTWQFLLVLILAYSTCALDPACCGQGRYLVEASENNDTIIYGCYNVTSLKQIANMTCQVGSYPVQMSLNEVTSTPIIKDKSLILDYGGEELITKDGSYCFADFLEDPNDTDTVTPSVLLCGTDEEPDKRMEVLAICMIVSATFYLATALIYMFLPPLRDLLGLCIICFCVAIGIGLMILGIVYLVSFTEFTHCAGIAFVAYYFLVAGFVWTNVISIQTYRSISKVASPNKDRKTFYWYSLYAWGVAVIFTSILAIVNFHPGKHSKPGIGTKSCWFTDLKQSWYYLYSVMTLLIVINFILFALISWKLWRSAKWQSDHATDIRYRFALTLKLFLIMGIPWISEMIISSVASEHKIWFILDIINVLQGVLVFLVLVVLRKRAVRAMHARGWFLCLSDAVAQYLHKAGDDEAQVVAQTDIQDMNTVDN